jgi:hypothetical protein
MGSEDAELQAYIRIGISPTDTFRASAHPASGSARLTSPSRMESVGLWWKSSLFSVMGWKGRH